MAEPHPWFRPLWRRVAVTAVCVAWAVFETVYGETPWDWIAFGAVGFAVWSLFLSGDYGRSGNRS